MRIHLIFGAAPDPPLKITAPTKNQEKLNKHFFLSLFLTFEGFKSSIFGKNGLEKLKRGVCKRHNRVAKL